MNWMLIRNCSKTVGESQCGNVLQKYMNFIWSTEGPITMKLVIVTSSQIRLNFKHIWSSCVYRWDNKPPHYPISNYKQRMLKRFLLFVLMYRILRVMLHRKSKWWYVCALRQTNCFLNKIRYQCCGGINGFL